MKTVLKRVLYFGVIFSIYMNSLSAQVTPIVIDTVLSDCKANVDDSKHPKQFPAVAIADDSTYVIVWQDDRNDTHGDIYAQRFDASANAVGSNTIVNDDGGYNYQSSPAIAISDADGSYVITWQDRRNGNWDIYAQRFDATGDTLGTNTLVNDDGGSSHQTNPVIAMAADGSFVIVWEDMRNGESDIYAQRYNTSGGPIGTNTLISDDDDYGTDQLLPSIGMSDAGSYVITWYDDNMGDVKNVYFQRYDASGNTVGSNTVINASRGSSINQRNPSVSIASDGSENFIISWLDDRNDINEDIYFQRFDESGIAYGSNILVNDDVGSNAQWNASIAMADSGSYVITWEDHRNDSFYPDIYAQRFDESDNAIGSNTLINHNRVVSYQQEPSLAITSNGLYIITWEDDRNGTGDIYSQLYNSSGNSIGSNTPVNDDVDNSDQWSPMLAMAGDGSNVITWEDQRNGNWDVYTQRFDSTGAAVGSNTMINDDGGSSDQTVSSVAMTNGGSYVTTWQDERNGTPDIYAQRFDASGNTVGTNALINDDGTGAYQANPYIAISDSGSYVIVWQDSRNGDRDIYAQRFDTSGVIIGSNVMINDDGGSSYQIYPSIAMAGNGSYVITWQDERNGNKDIYAQRYNASGAGVGSNTMINDDGGSSDQLYPLITMADDGSFAITWEDYRNGNWDIYAQLFESNGNAVGSNSLVNDDAGSNNQWNPVISMGNGNFYVVSWQDYRNGPNPDIYAQVYDLSGNKAGENYSVNSSSTDNGSTAAYPSVFMNNIKIYSTWQEDRDEGKGYDIFYNILEITNPSDYAAPIELQSFNSSYTKGNIILTWQTETETDNAYYRIYRNDELIATIEGAGTTSEPHNYEYIDDQTIPGNIYTYVLADVSYANEETKYFDNAITITVPENDIPTEFVLENNRPNPFNPKTTFCFQLSADSDVELSIFDMKGSKVATLINEHISADYYNIDWDASEFSSGIYFYRLKADDFIQTKKMIILK